MTRDITTCPPKQSALTSRKRRRKRVTKAKFNSAGASEERHDVYERITARIIADLEKGVRPWSQPWQGSGFQRPLRFNGLPYAGINVLMLWSTALERGYSAPFWMTFQQALELGAHVRKGEKGSLVVYANRIKKTETNEQGEDVEREIPFLKGYVVFNAEQIEGLPPHFYVSNSPRLQSTAQRIEHAEAFFAATGATIHRRGGRAFYRTDADFIQVPPLDAFPEAEEFYSTLAHEMVHWTRHPTRLARDFGRKSWGDEGYAIEELVAELGAAFLCADLGLMPDGGADIREDHASYIDSWLKVLKNDKRAIITAASHAQRAADYLHGFQPSPELDSAPSNLVEDFPAPPAPP
jgi:antirestriction protein ArdC